MLKGVFTLRLYIHIVFLLSSLECSGFRVIPVCNADLKFSCIVDVLGVCFFMELIAGKNKHLSFFGILISYQILFVFVCIDKTLSHVQ